MKTAHGELDDPQTTIKRIDIIERKKFLKRLYFDFYKIFREASVHLPNGKKVELGSGAGFLKRIMPDVITSDVMKLPNCDMTFAAEKIPFKDSSVSAILMLNVFHHIKNPKKALSEFQRCLKRGGKVVMIEPYNSAWGRFIYQNFHHETFDPKGSWKVEGKGDLSGANGAVPWIVFERDKNKFTKLYPRLRIKQFIPHTPFTYLLSGGFQGPSLLPHFVYPFVRIIENKLSFLNKKIGMFVTVILEKR